MVSVTFTGHKALLRMCKLDSELIIFSEYEYESMSRSTVSFSVVLQLFSNILYIIISY